MMMMMMMMVFGGAAVGGAVGDGVGGEGCSETGASAGPGDADLEKLIMMKTQTCVYCSLGMSKVSSLQVMVALGMLKTSHMMRLSIPSKTLISSELGSISRMLGCVSSARTRL